jgi:hypothetical protein
VADDAEIDLNLLLALGALLEDRNLTRAGERIGMSQPAMSAALARLRRHSVTSCSNGRDAGTGAPYSASSCCPRCARR